MQDPSTGVAEVSFPKKIKGTRDFKFLDEELQARTSLCCTTSFCLLPFCCVIRCL